MRFEILFALIIGVIVVTVNAAGYTDGHNGRSHCVSDAEVNRPWRNNNDPTRFWVCLVKGEPASEVKCKTGTLFMDDGLVLGCVENDKWQWTPPYDPPSLA